MPDVTITVTSVNDSLRVGDMMYYAPSSVVGGFNTVSSESSIVKMGPCKEIRDGAIVVDHSATVNMPAAGDFLLFSKDNSVNLSSISGYFAEAKFVNNSNVKGELFSVNVSVEQSSK